MESVFAGARAKADHALEHLNALDAHMQLVFGGQAYGVGGHYKPEVAEIDLYAIQTDFPLQEWGLRIGDCLHNLRSALDHIAWQLALAHLNREPTEAEAPKISFPISDTTAKFKGAQVRKFISREHERMLDQFQPYKAGDSAPRHRLGMLRRLSNADKHRVIHAAAVVPAEFEFEFLPESGIVSHGEIEVFHGTPLKDHTHIGRITDVVVSRPKPDIAGHGPFSVSVVFDDATDPVLHQESVVQVLGAIGETVNTVVTWFEREFAPPDTG